MSRLSFVVSLLCLLTALTPQPGQADPTETEITLEHDGTLAGALLLPDGEHPVPLVLIHPGSGPTNRDGNQLMAQNNSLKFLAEALAERGIASVRIDKRGVGASTAAGKPITETTIEMFVKDAEAWSALLKQREDVSSVHLLGHSLGGLIMTVVARKDAPASLVLAAAAGRRYSDLIKAQLKASPQIPETLHGDIDTIVASLEKGETVADVPPGLAFIFHPSVQPYLISMFSYDPAEELKRVKAPAMIVQGGRDVQITEPDFIRLKEARPDATALFLPKMTHVLKDAAGETRADSLATYTDPSLPLADGLADAIAAFTLEADKGRK